MRGLDSRPALSVQGRAMTPWASGIAEETPQSALSNHFPQTGCSARGPMGPCQGLWLCGACHPFNLAWVMGSPGRPFCLVSRNRWCLQVTRLPLLSQKRSGVVRAPPSLLRCECGWRTLRLCSEAPSCGGAACPLAPPPSVCLV